MVFNVVPSTQRGIQNFRILFHFSFIPQSLIMLQISKVLLLSLGFTKEVNSILQHLLNKIGHYPT